MRLPVHRPSAVLGSLAVAAVLTLSGCGTDDASGGAIEAGETSSAEPEVDPEVAEPEETEEPAEEETAPTSGEGQPSWALPVVTPGELLATVEAGDVTVEAYQVGTAKADDTGSFVDPDTNTPLIEVGDTLVFVNYVITNNGDPIDLGSSLVSVDARYVDWPYLGGMDGLTSDDLFEAQGINDFGLAPGGYSEEGIYTLGTGESFSYGENFEYQKNSPIDFDIGYVPVDSDGELLHDDRVEGEGSATIS